MQEQVVNKFTRLFEDEPTIVVRAPGRVNLIGEHTDYNDGFVLPMAIDRGVWVALRPRDDGRVFVYSADFEDGGEFDLDAIEQGTANSWLEYIKGVAAALQDEGKTLRGWEGVVTGNVPIGSGLSSSAALQVAMTQAFAAASDFEWEGTPMAKLVQRVENQWMGVQTGIMDQMISANGTEGNALLIDCRSLETTAVPLPDGTAVVVLDTMVRRGLVDSKYNERRAQCEAAAAILGVDLLRDVDLYTFLQNQHKLEPLSLQRARHVISENERTLLAAIAMQREDSAGLGALMNASHDSLRDDFEVSCDELDIFVAIAQKQAGCFGARMTGAGFGGCAVALISAEIAPTFTTNVATEYETTTGKKPNVYVCYPTNGAERMM